MSTSTTTNDTTPAKTAAKTAAKRPARTRPTTVKSPAAKAVTVAPAVTSATPVPAQEKASKAKKPKMVRDSFTFPKAEYTVLQELKDRSNQLASPAKKTELLRAGIKALAALSDDDFLKAIQSVPSLKTGRPSKNITELGPV